MTDLTENQRGQTIGLHKSDASSFQKDIVFSPQQYLEQ